MSRFYNVDNIILNKKHDFKILPRDYGKITYIIKRKITFLKNELLKISNSKSDIDLKEKIGYQIDILQDVLNEIEVIECK